MLCPNCGADNLAGDKFCLECGNALAISCPSCAAALPSRAKFCSQCGTTLTARPTAAVQAPAVQPSGAPTTQFAGGGELRHVSVLFCDLVGFTPFSESRDPEEVRDRLTGYFDLARAIVARYGGVVEKFIGDAVMAVWGAPVANEDDAERAVRAGLELVSAVAAYGVHHRTDLQARVGIVTGGAATTDLPEEGLVIGDRVNTAARIQSAAAPGCCYVDEATRSATAAAIAYSDAGEYELKGKSEPVRLFQATRVVAAVAGSQRSGVIEAPFVGRDRELHLVKELFHSTAERHAARLVLVSGVAGVGKSRLSWEFFKYIDGIAGDVLWHAGRCLSYGEGVSYWALAEMVRARLQISEDDPQEIVSERLRAGLERWIPEADDRDFIAPRLGQLFGMANPQVLSREELFAGWRLFFQRLSEHLPVVMVVEDLQWADAGLVDFLDHLLEWSGDHSIFLLVLSRPEGTERRGLVLSRRSVTTLSLDPLSDEVMAELLDGLVPGLPQRARARIVERAEGIPLYAIETLRGLLDKGVLEKTGDGALHLVADLGDLEIPPGLTALIGSRLDALETDERRLVKELSVLGGSFPRQAIEALSDIESSEIDDLLSSLVRKEVLTVRADKLSPERGQYAFTQSLIRSVAYDMLTRAERKARHVRTAEHLQTAFADGGAEVAEVIGAHLYDAYTAAGDDADAGELRSRACRAFAVAAERAETVGAPEASETAFIRAAALSVDEADRVRLIEGAGRAALDAGWFDRAIIHLETAIAEHRKAGRAIDAARLTSGLATALGSSSRQEEAVSRLRQALVSLEGLGAPAEVVAQLQAGLGVSLIFAGRPNEATAAIEEALTLAQHHELTEQLARSLNFKGIILRQTGRATEARALYELGLGIARDNGLVGGEMSIEANLSDLCMSLDLPGAEEHAVISLALCRRSGRRANEALAAANLMYILIMAGRFGETRQLGAELLQSDENERPGSKYIVSRLALLEAMQGNVAAARGYLAACAGWKHADDVQDRTGYAAAAAAVSLAAGDARQALDTGNEVIEEVMSGAIGVAHESTRLAFPVALTAAVEVGDLERADELLELMASRATGEVPPFLRGQVRRGRALVALARDEDDNVEANFIAAETTFRELGYRYWTALLQLERAEWLGRTERLEESASLGRDAATTLETLDVPPLLARTQALSRPPAVVASTTLAESS